jgi:hypothetical protein
MFDTCPTVSCLMLYYTVISVNVMVDVGPIVTIIAYYRVVPNTPLKCNIRFHFESHREIGKFGITYETLFMMIYCN